MPKYFLASLCKNGIIGGSITADREGFTYHTGKITVPQKYRNLPIPFREIRSVTTGHTLFFPWVSVSLSSDDAYKFIIFGRRRFLSLLRDQGIDC